MALGFYFRSGNFSPQQYDEAIGKLEAAGVGAPAGSDPSRRLEVGRPDPGLRRVGVPGGVRSLGQRSCRSSASSESIPASRWSRRSTTSSTADVPASTGSGPRPHRPGAAARGSDSTRRRSASRSASRDRVAGDRRENCPMGTLTALIDGLASGAIDVIDLTAPLSADTPIIQLPPEFGQTDHFALEEISRYDERGPAWYWNNFRSGEHTGTHFDAPSALGHREGPRRCRVSPGPSADRACGGARLLRAGDRRRRLPARGRGHPALGAAARTVAGRRLAALPHRLGRPLRRPGGLPERRRRRPAHAGHLRRMRSMDRRGVTGHRRRRPRPSAPTPAPPHSFDPAFPCHSYLLGSGKYGLTQLQRSRRAASDRRRPHRRAAAHRRRARAVRRGCWRWSSGDACGHCRRPDAGRTRHPPGVRASSAPATSTSRTPWSTGALGSSPLATRTGRRRWPTPTPA